MVHIYSGIDRLFPPVFSQAIAKYPDGTHIPNLKLSAAITVKLTDQTENTISKEVVMTKEGNTEIPFQVPKQATFIHIKVRI